MEERKVMSGGNTYEWNERNAVINDAQQMTLMALPLATLSSFSSLSSYNHHHHRELLPI